MSSSNTIASADTQAWEMRFPSFFPTIRSILDRTRCAINNKLDPLLDRSVLYIYEKMGKISGKIKKIL